MMYINTAKEDLSRSYVQPTHKYRSKVLGYFYHPYRKVAIINCSYSINYTNARIWITNGIGSLDRKKFF